MVRSSLVHHLTGRGLAAGRQPALVVAGRRWPGQFDAAHRRRVSSQLLHRYPGPCLFVPRPLSTSVGGASYTDSLALDG